jgi:hypothetical protein
MEERGISENVSVGTRAEFFARVQRFADEMLDSLVGASKGKDVDEKEGRALRSTLLKVLRIWDKALLQGQRDPRLEEMLRRVEKQDSEVKNGEA